MLRFPIVGLKYLSYASLFFFTTHAVAQDTLHDSRVLIEKGIGLYDDGKYKEALEHFLKVPEGDTNFATAQYETVLTYMADSSFERSKQVAFEGLKASNQYKRQLLYLVAHVYDYQGKADSAFYYYDSIARAYPVDNLAYYEKAVVYYQKKDFDKALPLLEKALLMNPYHYRSHAVLGGVYMQQGRLAEAYMANLAALLFTNEAKVAGSAIGALSAIARQSKEVSDYYDQRKEGLELYSEIDEIIHAKLALNKGYSIPSVMGDDQVIRVAHAVMEKLSYDKNEQNFAMQYYVPLFQQVYKKELFDPFILLLFSNYGIEEVEKYAKKQKKDITEVRELVFPYWDRVTGTRILEYSKRQNAPLKYSYDQGDGSYMAGNIGVEDGKLTLKEGKTMFYRKSELTAEGNFNNSGKKEGAWRYYHPNGVLRLTETYKNGVIQGEAYEYRNNGYLKEMRKYNSAGEQVEEHQYTYNGVLENAVIIRPDKVNELTMYHPDGHKQAVLKVKDGSVADGKYKSYYSNGKLEKEMEIQDGKLTGVYKEYYDNGQLREHGTFRKGDRDGMYTKYYENGKKESELNYSAGKADGERISYDEHGAVTDKTTFRDGKHNGTDIFVSEGKEYYVIDYKNDVPVGYTFKSPDGKEIKETSKTLTSLKVYHVNGNLKSDLPLKDGKIHGTAKYYFNTGSLREEVNFENDVKHGTAKEYFRNGKLYIVSEYVQGERTGWYKGYYANGQVEAEGWLLNNNKEGVWRFYSVAGKLEREGFYLNNEANGPSRHYNNNGKISFTDYYDRDLVTGLEQYDKTGKVIHQLSFPKGTGKYYMVFPNGNTSFEVQVKNGNYEGAYAYYYPDKTLREKGFYKNGQRDSLTVSYYPGGQESAKGYWHKGSKDGKWAYHGFDGKPERETEYLKGDEHGKDKFYQAGELRSEYNMTYDYMHGDQFFYGEGKTVGLVYNYKDRDLAGYTYMGKDGKLLPLIAVKNGTARITAYYPNGNKAVEENMIENKRDGKSTLYYSNGNVSEERYYAGIQLNGVYKRFYPDGKPSYEATYKDDVLNGEEKQYGNDGKVFEHANYAMGERHGLQVYYDAKTGKRYKLMYEHGELLTIENL